MSLFASMSFYMPIGQKKALMSRLIQEHGGQMKAYHQVGTTLCIVDKEDVQYSPQADVFYTNYITDCIEKQQVLNKELYRVPEQKAVVASKDSSGTPGAPHTSSTGNTRKKFTNEDDERILDAVNNSSKSYKGEALWREMEKDRVTDHTWQSMKNRYINSILPIVTLKRNIFDPRSRSGNGNGNSSNGKAAVDNALPVESMEGEDGSNTNHIQRQAKRIKLEDFLPPKKKMDEERPQQDQQQPQQQVSVNEGVVAGSGGSDDDDDDVTKTMRKIQLLEEQTSQHFNAVIFALNLFNGNVGEARGYLIL